MKDIKRVRYFYRWSSILILGVIATLFYAKTSVAITAQETEKIRVGFFTLPGFHEYDSNGNAIGYDVDYLERISEYTGWEYEFVQADSWVDALQMLDEEKIDLLAPAQITEDRKRKYLLSNYSFGTEYGSLFTWARNDNLIYEDFESFHNIRVGCVDTFIMRGEFLRYARQNDWIPNVSYYKDTNELLTALKDHRIDAAVGNLFLVDNTKKLLAKFAPSPYYYMTNKKNEDLMKQLNEAISRIKTENPDFENQLAEEHFPIFRQTPYTKAELEYIKEAPVYRVGYVEDHAPLSYVEDGEEKGIVIEIMNLISQQSGLQFEYVPIHTENVTYDDIREKDLSLITEVEYSKVNANAPGIRLTKPFFSSKKVLVGRKGIQFSSNAQLKIGIVTGSQTLSITIKENYPNFEIVNYPSTKDCLDAVANKKIDVMLQSQYAVENLLSKPKYGDLIVIPETGLEEKLSICAVLFSEEKGKEDEILSDSRLISVLNKAIDHLDSTTVNNILIAYTTGTPYKITTQDFLYEYRYTIFSTIVFLIIGITIAVFAWRQQIKHHHMIQNKEKQLRCITNNINGGVIVLTPDKGFSIQYANSGFVKMLGADEAYTEIIQSGSYITYVHQNDIEKLNQLIHKNLTEGTEIELELQIKKLNGEYLPVLFRGTLSDEDGKTILYCVVMDISEQKRMIQRLEIDRERFEMVIEQTDDIIFDTNVVEKVSLISSKFREIFGWSNAKYSDSFTIDEFHISPEDEEVYQRLKQDILEGKELITARFRVQKRNGEYIWCDITMKCIRWKGQVVRLVGKITDVDKLVKEHKRLQKMSNTDLLTGLLNKEAFQFFVSSCLKEEKLEIGCAMLFLDIDNFKTINDTLGHMIGDDAIKNTAEILKSQFRKEDLIGRFGGDEFVVFSKNIPLEVFLQKVEHLKEKMVCSYTDENGENMVSVSASIGITYITDFSVPYEELLEQADKALYKAKEQGKNRYVMYHDGIILKGYVNRREKIEVTNS